MSDTRDFPFRETFSFPHFIFEELLRTQCHDRVVLENKSFNHAINYQFDLRYIILDAVTVGINHMLWHRPGHKVVISSEKQVSTVLVVSFHLSFQRLSRPLLLSLLVFFSLSICYCLTIHPPQGF